MDQQCNKVELEGRAYEMSWDWDAEDIDPDKNDGRMWVPITPKTLEDKAMKIAETKPVVSEAEEEVPTIRSKSCQTMSMYAVTNRPGKVIQASMPILQVVGTPVMGPEVIVQVSSKWSRLTESSRGAE